jgi:sulfur relay protein TusB/DsrH
MKLISIIAATFSSAELQLLCQADDAIILRQDAVYLCLQPDILWPTKQLYALDSDLAVRQISAKPGITVVSARRWVELCANAEQNLLWPN